MILRPYIWTTWPARSKIGITSEPFKCSWPLSRMIPSFCKRPRISAPALRFWPAGASPACGWQSPAGSGRSSPGWSGRVFPDTQRLGRLLQRLVIESGHACSVCCSSASRSIGGGSLRTVELRPGAAGGCQRRMIGAEQFDGMAEADALAFITQSMTEPPVWQAPRQSRDSASDRSHSYGS